MNIRSLLIIVASALLLIASGCQKKTESNNAWNKISALENERADLTDEVKGLKEENAQLAKQVATLAKFDSELRLEMISNLERITIDKRSGFFDKDDDGTVETLIVYIRPYDDSGDVIKTAGDAQVQLWDLSNEPQGALLGEWNVEAKDLKSRWMGMLMTNYYRLSYKIPELLNDKQTELTIRVKFVEYLSGKIFEEQMVVSRNL